MVSGVDRIVCVDRDACRVLIRNYSAEGEVVNQAILLYSSGHIYG